MANVSRFTLFVPFVGTLHCARKFNYEPSFQTSGNGFHKLRNIFLSIFAHVERCRLTIYLGRQRNVSPLSMTDEAAFIRIISRGRRDENSNDEKVVSGPVTEAKTICQGYDGG